MHVRIPIYALRCKQSYINALTYIMPTYNNTYIQESFRAYVRCGFVLGGSDALYPVGRCFIF